MTSCLPCLPAWISTSTSNGPVRQMQKDPPSSVSVKKTLEVVPSKDAFLDDLSTDVGTDTMFSDLGTIADIDSDIEAQSDSDSMPCSPSSGSGQRVRRESRRKRRGYLISREVQEKVSALLRAEVVRPWDQTYQRVRLLQESHRNTGDVILMRSVEDGGKFAVKRMPRDWMTASAAEFERKHPYETEKIWTDVGILRYLGEHQFPYVCKLIGVFQDARYMYVASALATGGDLCSWCFKQTDCCQFGEEREATIRPIVKQTLEAVRHLHDLGIGHRDLSLENVVLCMEGNDAPCIKLIDFAMGTLEPWNCHELCSKKSFRALEMYTGKYNAFLTDAFALGVMIFILAVDAYPWNSTEHRACKYFEYYRYKGLRKLVQVCPFKGDRGDNGSSRKMIDVISEPLLQVLEGLTAADHRERFTLGEGCWSKLNAPRTSVLDMQWLA